jgi:hypothetical protein
MKKQILFAVIGGIILWMWQFISFAAGDFHRAAHKYTPLQDKLMSAFQSIGLEEGQYQLGQIDPALIRSGEATGFENAGGPRAILHWRPATNDSMVMNMLRGVFVCIIVAGLLFYLVRSAREISVGKGALMGLAVGVISFLVIPYTNFIWYQTPDIYAHLLDAFVPWLAMGAVAGKMA